MGKYVIVSVVASVMLLSICFTPRVGRCGESWLQQRDRQAMEEYRDKMLNAQKELIGKPRAEWSQDAEKSYLFWALYTLCYATTYYIDTNRAQPASADSLRQAGILDQWPGNPYREWEPMTWVSTSATFAAGDLVFQPCPPSEYSYAKHMASEIPLTFVLSINGSSETAFPAPPLPELFPWAQVPSGTAFILGTRYSTAAYIREKKAQAKREQESSNSSNDKKSSGTEINKVATAALPGYFQMPTDAELVQPLGFHAGCCGGSDSFVRIVAVFRTLESPPQINIDPTPIAGHTIHTCTCDTGTGSCEVVDTPSPNQGPDEHLCSDGRCKWVHGDSYNCQDSTPLNPSCTEE
jgi:hypothetical protein